MVRTFRIPESVICLIVLRPQQPEHFDFLESGLGSVVASSGDNESIEVGDIGFEGMSRAHPLAGWWTWQPHHDAQKIEPELAGRQIILKEIDTAPELSRPLQNPW
jgi:hypothetical protein